MADMVVYKRKSTVKRWEQMRADEQDLINVYVRDPQFKPNVAQIIANLRAVASAEREKELALIKEKTGIDISNEQDEITFIRCFNEIIMGVDELNNAIQRAKAGLTNKNKQTIHRAPMISSLFGSYFSSEINEAMKSLVRNLPEYSIETPFSKIEEEIKNYLLLAADKALDKAFQLTLKDPKMAQYGDKSQYEALRKYYKELVAAGNKFPEQFRAAMYRAYGLDSFMDRFKTYANSYYDENGKKIKASPKVVKNFTKDFKTKANSMQIAGSVYEYINTLIGMLESGMSGSLQNGVVFGGTGTGSQRMKTDSVLLYHLNMDADIPDVTNDLLEMVKNIGTPADLINSGEIFSQQTEQLSNKLTSKDFIIYTSAKAYAVESLGKKGGRNELGYSITKGGTMKYAETVMGKGGVANAQQLITAVINTVHGAIYEGNSDAIEAFSAGIASSIAKFLFDDWAQIGVQQTGGQAIHVMALSGLQVPLSFYLNRLATAFESLGSIDVRDLVAVDVVTPKDILWPEKVEGIYGHSYAVREPLMRGAWQEQQAAALADTKFNIHILKTFADIINTL